MAFVKGRNENRLSLYEQFGRNARARSQVSQQGLEIGASAQRCQIRAGFEHLRLKETCGSSALQPLHGTVRIGLDFEERRNGAGFARRFGSFGPEHSQALIHAEAKVALAPGPICNAVT